MEQPLLYSIEKHRQMIVASKLLTARQFEVVLKRIKRERLTQVEANYLSKYIRPKIFASKYVAEINLFEQIDDPRRITIYNIQKPSFYINGEEFMLKERIDTAKEVVEKFSQRYKNSKILLFGSFLTKNKFNDIDILILSKKYANYESFVEGKFHLQFAESEESDILLIKSIKQICISSSELGDKPYKATFNDFLEFHFLIDDLLEKHFSPLILTKLRHLVLLHTYLVNNTILNTIELESKLEAIFNKQYVALKNKKYSVINPKKILAIIRPIVILSLKIICKEDNNDLKALEENITLFSATKKSNKFHKFLYEMYLEVIK